MDEISKVLSEIRIAEDKFRKIQENPAMYGAEYGLNVNESELLGKVINLVGEVNIAADSILKRC
ncbi:MAG: hypothetical protein FWD47_09290 [Treponema sp.]|nr:hypothetical protein [Treponema sp.]